MTGSVKTTLPPKARAPQLRAFDTTIMSTFFDVISPNPTALFVFANLLSLALSASVMEPNHFMSFTTSGAVLEWA